MVTKKRPNLKNHLDNSGVGAILCKNMKNSHAAIESPNAKNIQYVLVSLLLLTRYKETAREITPPTTYCNAHGVNCQGPMSVCSLMYLESPSRSESARTLAFAPTLYLLLITSPTLLLNCKEINCQSENPSFWASIYLRIKLRKVMR